jgi:hypothetical protein
MSAAMTLRGFVASVLITLSTEVNFRLIGSLEVDRGKPFSWHLSCFSHAIQ